MMPATMSDEPLQVWCDMTLPAPELAILQEQLAPHRLLLISADPASTSPGARFDTADIALGQPPPDLCTASPRLRWVHLSTAGYTAYDRPAVRAALAGRKTALTTSSSVYSEPCAQHVLAFMLTEARQLGRSLRHQLGDRAWPQKPTRSSSRLLRGETVALVGLGSIAVRLAELLAPFGLEVVGVRRAPRGDEPLPVVPLAGLEGLLGRADHVVDLLPGSADTARFFDRARFAAMKPGAAFYNVGRGTTVDQDALLEALASGRLRAAYLDVTDPEPLPPQHPLWSAPGCVITPHAAGGHTDEARRLIRHFLANLARFQAGQALLDRVV
jgi:phosphoglycerate dehydrogenase-like enzyme